MEVSVGINCSGSKTSGRKKIDTSRTMYTMMAIFAREYGRVFLGYAVGEGFFNQILTNVT